jgi:hypothetical protein
MSRDENTRTDTHRYLELFAIIATRCWARSLSLDRFSPRTPEEGSSYFSEALT